MQFAPIRLRQYRCGQGRESYFGQPGIRLESPRCLVSVFDVIDKTGKTIFAVPGCSSALPFSEGLAAVQIAGRWGFVDHTGKLVIPAQFDQEPRQGGGKGLGADSRRQSR